MISKKIKTIIWSFKTAWMINKGMLLMLFTLCAAVSVLPALTLRYNREVLRTITDFVTHGAGVFSDIVPLVVILGIFMTLVGLSSRLNTDLMYMLMYDSFYLGLEELMMDSIQKVELTELLRSGVHDAHHFAVMRSGALTDVMSGGCTLFAKTVGITALLIVALGASKTIFFVTLIYVLAVYITNAVFSDRIMSGWDKIMKNERYARYLEKLPQDTGIAKEIRVFNNTEVLVGQWAATYEPVIASENKRRYQRELRNFLSGIGFYLFIIAMFVITLFDVAEGRMGTDVFLMLYVLCMNLYSTVTDMTKGINRVDSGLYALQKQMDFIENTPHVENAREDKAPPAATESAPVFEAKNLTFRYSDGPPAINDISFSVNEGETVALVGLNGSGKTTLVKLLLDMFSPESGELEFYGRPYHEYPKSYIRKSIGVFFQDYYLFHHTMGENVGYGGIENIYDEERIMDAIEKGGAAKVFKKMHNGLKTMIGKYIDQDGIELSMGEKQRIASSRAYMNDADIMVFDEPASMLDPIAEMEQFLQIKNKLEGRTAILISHRVGFARLADKIIMLENGRIVQTGTHDQLMKEGGSYSAFFNEQAQWYQKERSFNGS